MIALGRRLQIEALRLGFEHLKNAKRLIPPGEITFLNMSHAARTVQESDRWSPGDPVERLHQGIRIQCGQFRQRREPNEKAMPPSRSDMSRM
jgi:hypothetical protein